MARTYQHLETTDQPTGAALLRWSSVFGGVVIGGAILLLLATLWLALGAATGVDAIADGLGWFVAGSAIVALFVGGWLAGALSGVPGIGPGIVNGLAVWGVILVLSALVGTPGALNLAVAPGIDLPALEPQQTLWPAFWSLLIGALTAAAGGAIGGLTTRGAAMPVAERRYEERYRDRDERDYRDRDYRDEAAYRDRDYRDEAAYRDRDYRDRDEAAYRDERERDYRERGEREGALAGRPDARYRDEGSHRDEGSRDEGSYRAEGGRRQEGRPAERDRYPDDRPPPAERAAPSERAYAERAGGRGEHRPDEHGR